MIYIDSSVALAHLLNETRSPPPDIWASEPVSSQLLEYEVWTRLNAYNAPQARKNDAADLLAGTMLVDLRPETLDRLRLPFPVPLRTIDAIHLSTIHYLLGRNASVRLASYDARMYAAATALGIPLYDLP